LPGEAFIVEFVTVAIGKKKLANQHFRLCVFGFAAHPEIGRDKLL
jgi:hypothetical protein